MGDEPDLDALRALTLVAEESSISAAGARLGVSQQAVSLRIRGLERQLGVRLLVRSARGSRLTPAGELVVGWATALLRTADGFSSAVESLRTDRAKTMRIAASLTIAEHLLPEWIARWRRAQQQDTPLVQLVAANSSEVIRLVRTGEAQLGFIETPTVPDDVRSLPVGEDEIVVVVPPTHPWARRRNVSKAELAATPLVLREEGSGTRAALEAVLARADAPLSAVPVAELSTTLGVRSTIAAGDAPGALSSLAVADDLRAGRLRSVAISDLRMTRSLHAIWTGSPQPRNAAGDLLSAINQLVRRS
ncbi:LysR family transcriptional regulator [Georgenia sp. TF02-10]|uniref:LysR family transcriptional regulator n=1 Tax=Georgenia sp. TF02-10 TaxID=2917725 RepID=UPI001FA7FC7F|nr:LysR family transcriptional regulator [Georgenia sp. TF02-10]UNX54235.1 LysR family transcriptional regulator [Georgenia sp. TF02-10]